jgi:PAS domain S-box-containing protein
VVADTVDAITPAFLAGGGEMGALLRAHDWSSHPLGPAGTWPQSLKTGIRLMLNVGHPAYVFWGEAGYCFYNDGYRPSIGPERHPVSIGRRAFEVWSEIWDIIGPQIKQVMSGRGATWNENQLVPITRHGRREDVYWTYSYSPIDDETAPNGVGGVLVICTETTHQVLARDRLTIERERQRQMLRQMPGFAAMLVGPDYRFEYVNDAYIAIAGERDFVGRTVREVFPELAQQGFYELLDRVYATGEPFAARTMPILLDRPDGNRFIDLLYQPLRDDAGIVSGIFVGGYDVTDRVRAERRRDALITLDKRFRDIVDPAELSYVASELLGNALGAIRVGYGVIDPEARSVAVERAWIASGFADVPGKHLFSDYGSYIEEMLLGASVSNENVASDSRTAKHEASFRALGIRAHLDVPVLEDGRAVAQMFVHSALPRTWTEEEIAFVRDVAERTRIAIARRRAEQELRASEAELRFTLKAGRFGAWALDLTSGDMETSEICRSNFGRDADKTFTYAELHEAVHPDDRARMGEAVEQSIATGEDYDIEYRIITPAGEKRWVQIRGQPAYAADGSPQWMRGVSIDITDRRRAEAELHDLAERLSLATETAEVGFWDVDPVNEVLIWPPRTKAMFGISSDVPVTMQDFYDGLHPEDKEATSAAYEAATDPARRALYDVEYRTVGREDGKVRWVAAKGRGIFDDSGGCLRVLGTAIDITARRATEAALHESETRYQALFDTIDEGFCVIELLDGPHGPLSDYIHVEANAAFVANAGLPDSLGKRLRELVSEAEAEVWMATYRDVFLSGKPTRFDRELVETGRQLEVAAFRVEPSSRRQVAVLFKDVSDRKRAEAALRDLANSLERRVAERTSELEAAHQQLRQSQKLEAMGSLTGGVAHDFNNLLTPIVGVLDILQRKSLGGEREQRLIGGAIQSAERAKTLVQRLLAFARRQPLQPVAVDLGQLVRNMADLVSSTTGPQIKVVVDVADGLPLAKADPNQLEMALLNLSVNARDAMPDGGMLRISASKKELPPGVRSELKAGWYLCLSVADTGAGMDETTLARAVEPFFSTKGVGKGTGLGLSMVHGLASQLDGALTITSKRGLGTNVELWLPQTDAMPQTALTVVEDKALRGRGIALLVDDEEFVRMSTADMLVELGFTVVEAPSAEEALRVINEGTTVDIIITDHLMPGMTGIDLALAVRERQLLVPVLIMSGYAEVEGIAPNLPRLTKPFRKEELVASLADLAV